MTTLRTLYVTAQFPILMAVLGGILALLFSFALPWQFSSTVRVLVTQPNTVGLDPYTAVKTSERIATTLSEIVYTSHFFENVMLQAKGFEQGFFPIEERAKRRAWRKIVETKMSLGSGIMSVSTFHHDRGQARILVEAVARELAFEAPNLFGYNVRVQLIDAPLDSSWIARPNFFQNIFWGIILGLFFGSAWTFARYSWKK